MSTIMPTATEAIQHIQFTWYFPFAVIYLNSCLCEWRFMLWESLLFLLWWLYSLLAEWQVLGLAKCWNDDPIIWSDSEMRDIRQRFHPFPISTLSPASYCQMCRLWLICLRRIVGSRHWFFNVLSKNIFTDVLVGLLFHGLPVSPPWVGVSEQDNTPYSMTRQITCNFILEMSQ